VLQRLRTATPITFATQSAIADAGSTPSGQPRSRNPNPAGSLLNERTFGILETQELPARRSRSTYDDSANEFGEPIMSDAEDNKGKDKTFKIHVNGTEKTVDHGVLTFAEVVNLAFPAHDPATIFSVTFSHGRDPKDGELLEGETVTIKNNTEFDVDDTGRS
jgi:hypothetical protein